MFMGIFVMFEETGQGFGQAGNALVFHLKYSDSCHPSIFIHCVFQREDYYLIKDEDMHCFSGPILEHIMIQSYACTRTLELQEVTLQMQTNTNALKWPQITLVALVIIKMALKCTFQNYQKPNLSEMLHSWRM